MEISNNCATSYTTDPFLIALNQTNSYLYPDMEYNLTDHLGSTRMMYKLNFTCVGVYQNATIQYLADYYSFGKIVREYINPGTTAEKYQYTGKERDTESGYDYFNARNYHSEVGRFLSVDPLAHKYPSLSPYCFVANNPIYYVDPDGREIWIAFDVTNKDGSTTQQKVQYKDGKLYGTDGKAYTGGNEYATKVMGDLNQLSKDNTDLAGRITTLQDSKNVHTISMVTDATEGNSHTPLDFDKRAKGEPTGSNVEYDPDAKETVTGDKRAPRVGLAHELLGHSYDTDQGTTDMGNTANGIRKREVSAVNAENRARAATGDPKRTSYGGKEIPAELLDDTHKEKKP